MRTRLCVALLVAVGGVGCGQKVPPATQPKLESVNIVGYRLCADLTTGGQTFNFPCPPLPTDSGSGWVLSPPWTPSTMVPGRQHLNRVATLTVSGPSLTEIDVELARLGAQPNLPLASVDPNLPGKPGEVAGAREVGVVSQDSGNGKTWKIDVNVSGCADFREVKIFNRSNNVRSNPLSVDAAPRSCRRSVRGRRQRPHIRIRVRRTGPGQSGESEADRPVCGRRCGAGLRRVRELREPAPAVGQRVHGLLGVQLERRAGGLRLHRPGDHEAAALHDSTGQPGGVRRPMIERA